MGLLSFFTATKSSFYKDRLNRERDEITREGAKEKEMSIMGVKSQRDTRHFMRLWGIVYKIDKL